MTDSVSIAIAGTLLLGGAFSNKLSSRFNLPALLLFLLAGVIAEYFLPINGAAFARQINFFGIIAIVYILYSGGLETDVNSVRKIAVRGMILAGPGVLLTALATGFGAYFIFGGQYPLLWCLLLGAIISSTDAGAVFAILRGRSVGLKGNLKPLLEFESGSNDPMAAMITLLLISMCVDQGGSVSWWSAVKVVWQLAGGILAGIGFGWLGKHFFQVKLEYDGLYFVISVALVLVCYGISEILLCNGFLACYVCGLSMSSLQYNYKVGLRKFHNGLAWLMQVAMFILLGFLAEPRGFLSKNIWSNGLLLGFFMILVARPLAVFICMSFSKYTLAEKVFVSWVGIRGAAPIVLATFPLAAGVPYADMMFQLIFFIVILSVMLQGWLLMPVARLLKLDKPMKRRMEPAPLELEITRHNHNQEMLEFHVSAESDLVGKTLAQIAFPAGVLVTMIRRGNGFIAPRGDCKVCEGDGMLIIGDRELLQKVAAKYFEVNS